MKLWLKNVTIIIQLLQTLMIYKIFPDHQKKSLTCPYQINAMTFQINGNPAKLILGVTTSTYVTYIYNNSLISIGTSQKLGFQR